RRARPGAAGEGRERLVAHLRGPAPGRVPRGPRPRGRARRGRRARDLRHDGGGDPRPHRGGGAHVRIGDVTGRCHDALTLALDGLPLGPEGVREGGPRAGITTLYDDLGVEIGVWELTAGTVTDTEADEVFVVVAGSGSVTFEDGEQIDLRPGVVVRLHAGE